MTPCSQKDSGFTLTELLVAIVLSLMVVAGVYNLFVSQTKVYFLHNQLAETRENVTFALDRIVSDLQMGGYDPQRTGSFGVTAYQANDFPPSDTAALALGGNTQIFFTVDDDGDGVIDNNSTERFGIRVNSTSLETPVISSTNGSITSWQVIAENVESLTFSYTYANGNNSTAVGLPNNNVVGRAFDDIRSVTVSLTARGSQPDPNYNNPSVGDHYRRISKTGQVFLRNLAF